MNNYLICAKDHQSAARRNRQLIRFEDSSVEVFVKLNKHRTALYWLAAIASSEFY
jgi:hypothetical protein